MYTEYSNLFVCLMGIGTVFVGLVCLILLITIMGLICRKTESAPVVAPAPIASAAPAVPASGATPELIAAISAAIAEELGTDISAIRITSLKQL